MIKRKKPNAAVCVIIINRRAKSENASKAVNCHVTAVVQTRHDDLDATDEESTGVASGHMQVT